MSHNSDWDKKTENNGYSKGDNMKWTPELAQEKNYPNQGGHRPVEYKVDGCNFRFTSIDAVAAYIESTKGAVQGRFYRSGKDEIEINGTRIKRYIKKEKDND